jgi:hypothetical protein
MKRTKKPKRQHELKRRFSLPEFLKLFSADNPQVDPGFINGLHGAIRANDLVRIRELIDQWGSPTEYEDPFAYFRHAQACAFVKKYPNARSSRACEDSAYQKFMEAEAMCEATNLRLLRRIMPVHLNDIFANAIDIFNSILGDFTEAYPQVLEGSKHGSGSSLTLSGPRVTEFYKYAETPYEGTMGTRAYLEDVYNLDEIIPNRTEVALTNVAFNKLAFVPKDSWTHRTIAIEPRLNLYLQLGVNSYLTPDSGNSELISEPRRITARPLFMRV